jgi:hypothetical protein
VAGRKQGSTHGVRSFQEGGQLASEEGGQLASERGQLASEGGQLAINRVFAENLKGAVLAMGNVPLHGQPMSRRL